MNASTLAIFEISFRSLFLSTKEFHGKSEQSTTGNKFLLKEKTKIFHERYFPISPSPIQLIVNTAEIILVLKCKGIYSFKHIHLQKSTFIS